MDDLSKELENINSSIDADADIILELLENTLKREKSKYEAHKKLFNKLGFQIENYDPSTKKCITELAELQFQLGCTEATFSNLILGDTESKIESLKEKRLMRKLSSSTKYLSTQINNTRRLIDRLERESAELKEENKSLGEYAMQTEKNAEKIKKYKDVLKKLKNDFPNCDSPDNDVEKFQLEISKLKELQRKHDEVSAKLAEYHGASPDLELLRKQVQDMEIKYKELQAKLHTR